jgi:uncharacterized membrane protein
MGHANRIVLFAAFVVIATFLALSSIGELPERVAIHFTPDGQADRWTSRETYRLSLMLSLVLVPSLLVWLMAGLPRLTGGKGQIPNAEYWFAQERRQATERFLISHASWLGCMTVAIVYAMHLLILRAHAVAPPSLATDRLITMVLIYLCGLAWWFVAFMRHFQRLDEHD